MGQERRCPSTVNRVTQSSPKDGIQRVGRSGARSTLKIARMFPETLTVVAAVLGAASLIVWLALVFGRGGFWQVRPTLPARRRDAGDWPAVAAVVPARNEADVLPATLPGLLSQDYPGPFHVFLVDDRSEDGTSEAALAAARESGRADRLTLVPGVPAPDGWAGKVWALSQGVEAAGDGREYLWFTDSDVAHPPDALARLASHAERERLDLASVMVRLSAARRTEKLLIPAFVYFFGKLYPFQWASDPGRREAAAAGGCVVVRRRALEDAGGLAEIAGELIDDCALAALVKRRAKGRTWLGHDRGMCSVRGYGGIGGVWSMVARTAYTQLGYSARMLALTVAGMLLTYAAPVFALGAGIAGLVCAGPSAATGIAGAAVAGPDVAALLAVSTGLAAWLLMSASFAPMLRWYRVPVLLSALLSLAGLLYTGMTVDSAVRRWRGHGASWKGRTYG